VSDARETRHTCHQERRIAAIEEAIKELSKQMVGETKEISRTLQGIKVYLAEVGIVDLKHAFRESHERIKFAEDRSERNDLDIKWLKGWVAALWAVTLGLAGLVWHAQK